MNYNFYTETNFKQTEIGEIPEDGDVVRLGEVVDKKFKREQVKKIYKHLNEGDN